MSHVTMYFHNLTPAKAAEVWKKVSVAIYDSGKLIAKKQLVTTKPRVCGENIVYSALDVSFSVSESVPNATIDKVVISDHNGVDIAIINSFRDVTQNITAADVAYVITWDTGDNKIFRTKHYG